MLDNNNLFLYKTIRTQIKEESAIARMTKIIKNIVYFMRFFETNKVEGVLPVSMAEVVASKVVVYTFNY